MKFQKRTIENGDRVGLGISRLGLCFIAVGLTCSVVAGCSEGSSTSSTGEVISNSEELVGAQGGGESGSGQESVEGDSVPPLPLDNMPDFKGPWAEDFSQIYKETSSQFVREVLADEVVTEQELSEMHSKFSNCVSAFGVTNVKFKPDGSMSIDTPPNADQDLLDDQIRQCSQETGEDDIGSIYSWVRRNPDNLDEDTIMAACLVRKGAMDSSFSVDDYRKTREEGSALFEGDTKRQEKERQCHQDPLGLFE